MIAFSKVRSVSAVGTNMPGRQGEPDPERLVRAIRAHEPWAERALLENFSSHVTRILARILGTHAELEDLVQEVFIRAFARIDALEDPDALGGWLTSIAVFVAREAIRKKKRRGWLSFFAPERLPEVAGEVHPADAGTTVALHATYAVLDKMPVDARTVFALRYIEGLELTAVAAACDLSLATVKRRIKSAEEIFLDRSKEFPVLNDWIDEGARWTRG